MAGILSIGKGYDPDYLTKSVGLGAENYYLSAVREHGEPPGRWSGPGAEKLGLAPGSEVDPKVMEKVYGDFLDPRDPAFRDGSVPDSEKARLGRKAAKYASVDQIYAQKLSAEPEATEERKLELRIQAKKESRKALQFFDLTYSVHKSVTLTHAGLLATARQAEEAGDQAKVAAARAAATEIQHAIEEAAAAGVERGREVAGWARVGYHGKKINGVSTGRWAPAGGWVVASFFQHTSRNGDPQLHVHQAVLNRQECADGAWRSLDGQAIYRVRAEASAVAERTMMERLTRTLGLEFVPAADGQNFQVKGVNLDQIAAFSTRRAEVTERLAELAEAYEARHGYAPNARALFTLAQQATKDTKTAKPKLAQAPTQAEELAAWEQRTTDAEIDSLTKIPGRALFRVTDTDRTAAAAELAELDMDRVIAAAIADAQAEKSTFSEFELTRHISRHLPASFGGLGADQVKRLILQIRDEALRPEAERVLPLTVADVVAVPRELQHADGRSVFRDPTYERWTTPEELDAEARFIRRAAFMDAPAAAAEQVAERLGYPRGHGGEDAVSAPTSGPEREATAVSADAPDAERASVAEVDAEPDDAAAESGVDHDRSEVSGAASEPARGESAPDRENYAFGLTSDQVAAVYEIVSSGRQIDVLEGYAGTGKSYTVARTAEVWRELTGGNVVGLTTAQNAAYVLQNEGLDEAWNLARWLNAVEKGTTRLEEGQLVVVDEGSMVTNDTMTKVAELARAAGAKVLVTGDSEQLAAPGAGGLMRQLVKEQGSLQLTEVKRFSALWEREASVRLRAGDEDVLAVYDQQGRIRGGTREEMAQSARDAYLADYLQGRQSLLLVGTNPEATEMSGQVRDELVRLGVVDDSRTRTLNDGNKVGVWDRITARENDRRIRIGEGDAERQLTNRDVLRVQGIRHDGDIRARLLDRDGNPGAYVTIPAEYVEKSVELAYAGTAHSAQGRTVDTCHALVDETMARQMLYVEMSRGRHGNWAWVITDQQNVADLRPEPVPTPAADEAERETDTSNQERSTADSVAVEPEGGQPILPGLEPAAQIEATGTDATGSTPERTPDAPEQGADAPERDALGVLAGVLENDQSDMTATETMRAEAERVTHMAHLGSEWTSVVKDALADETTKVLEEVLPPEVLDRLDRDPARGSVITAVRQAVIAGHDLHTVIDRSTREGWGRARSIGQVLSARIQGLIGTGDAPPGQTWVERTPHLPNPRLNQFVREVAEHMDAKVEVLGEQAAREAPAWLTERLGPVPEEIMARTEWQHRAGLAYAYREQYSTDEATSIGPAPDRHSPEQRAAWQAAHDALGTTRDEREVAEAGDGQLWVQRARYEREAAWAPPHVGTELRDARVERDDRHREAARLDAQATHTADEAERGWLRSRAEAARALMQQAGQRIASLEVVDRARAAWHAATEPGRQAAMRADAELHRRHRGLDLPPLHQTGPDEEPRPEPAVQDPEQDAPLKGQEVLFDVKPVRRGLTERPAPQTDPIAEPARDEPAVHAQQEELDLDLAPQSASADRALHRALEQAAVAERIIADRAKTAARAENEREAEPGPVERQRERTYRDALSRREQAELDHRQETIRAQEQRAEARRAAAQRQQVAPSRRPPERPVPQPRPVERHGPELGL